MPHVYSIIPNHNRVTDLKSNRQPRQTRKLVIVAFRMSTQKCLTKTTDTHESENYVAVVVIAGPFERTFNNPVFEEIPRQPGCANETELSKYAWNLKQQNIQHQMVNCQNLTWVSCSGFILYTHIQYLAISESFSQFNTLRNSTTTTTTKRNERNLLFFIPPPL